MIGIRVIEPLELTHRYASWKGAGLVVAPGDDHRGVGARRLRDETFRKLSTAMPRNAAPALASITTGECAESSKRSSTSRPAKRSRSMTLRVQARSCRLAQTTAA